MTRPHPRRSVLFVPAAHARALAGSLSRGADALIFDLEDAVAPEEKASAREQLRDHLLALRGRLGRPEIIVRINPLASLHGTEDMLMARGAGVDAILLPKAESGEDVARLAIALAETDAPPALRIFAMIETARGVLAAPEIAAAGRGRLAALVVGPNDIAASTGIRAGPGRTELLPILVQVVLAARANGLDPLDGVFNDFSDRDGFAAECASARRLGFAGKTLIHPSQVEPANRAFAPDAAEIAQARRIVEAFAAPGADGLGVLKIDGRMVERLHLEEARRLLALAEAAER